MNRFLFIVGLVISAAVISVFVNEIKSDREQAGKPTEKQRNIRSIARGITVFMVSVGVCDAFKFINFGLFSDSYMLMGTASALAYGLCELNKRKPLRSALFTAKILLFAFVMELTVFNVPVYKLWFGDYKEINFKADEQIYESGGIIRKKKGDISVRRGQELVLSFKDLDTAVGTVYVDLYFDGGTKGADFMLDATDETQDEVCRVSVGKGIIAKDKWQTQYLICELSGKTQDARVRIRPQNGGSLYVRSVTFNMPIMMEISWIRFFMIIILSCFIYEAMKGSVLKKDFTANRKLCRTFAVVLTAFACLMAVVETNKKLGISWKDELTKTSGNQMTQQLVDAFENGRTYLLKGPDEALLEFDDPYDNRHREDVLAPQWKGDFYSRYIWDHVYYDGKLYSYYGIAPVVLLFMPYHLITGYYFSDPLAILIFAIIGLIGLSFVYTEFVKKLFPKLETSFYIMGLVIIEMVCGVWYSIGRPMFYEIAMSAGFAAFTWAVYFLFSSNIIGKGKISLPRTAIASLLLAVGVLSRPTLVLYCIAAAVLMVCSVPRITHGKKKFFTKDSVRYLCCAIVPMACLGMVQMCYNYARFGSPFEFGIQYSLTINDFTKTQFHWRLSMIPVFNYLFNTPQFSPEYPIVSTQFRYMGVNGFFYNDTSSTHNTSGIFFLALPLFSYLAAGKALKQFDDRKTKLKTAAIIAVPCLIIPFGIIASVWESGYSARYMTDFAWQMLLGAYAILFFLYTKLKKGGVKKIVRGAMCFSLVWTIIVCGVQIVNQGFRYCEFHLDYPEVAYEVERIFAFWK